ncbi:MAG: hypothetical protein JWP66_1962 [Naasia sp.]|nr:hypothetical protein [Naasia sp.]
MRNAGRNVWDALRSAVEIEFNDFKVSIGGSVSGEDLDLARALYETANLARRTGKEGFVLMLDEAQVLTDERDREGEHPLSMLIAAVNVLQGQQVPIGLVLCGLPTLKANLLKARTYTERMFRGQEVARLSRSDTRDAFVKPLESTDLTAEPELVEAVLEDVEGYPYFIQLWGASLWEDAELAGEEVLSARLLEAIRESIYNRLDNDFYDPRIESLTPAEQDLLLLTSECSYPPLRTAEVHEHTERKEGNVNVLMGRLAEQGVVYRTSKGIYEYTAPKFHEYLKRRRRKDEWV